MQQIYWKQPQLINLRQGKSGLHHFTQEYVQNQSWFPLLLNRTVNCWKSESMSKDDDSGFHALWFIKGLEFLWKIIISYIILFSSLLMLIHTYIYTIFVFHRYALKSWTARQLFSVLSLDIWSLGILLWTNTAPQNSITLHLLRILPQCKPLILAKNFSP